MKMTELVTALQLHKSYQVSVQGVSDGVTIHDYDSTYLSVRSTRSAELGTHLRLQTGSQLSVQG